VGAAGRTSPAGRAGAGVGQGREGRRARATQRVTRPTPPVMASRPLAARQSTGRNTPPGSKAQGERNEIQEKDWGRCAIPPKPPVTIRLGSQLKAHLSARAAPRRRGNLRRVSPTQEAKGAGAAKVKKRSGVNVLVLPNPR
jgi:hypothetical protein